MSTFDLLIAAMRFVVGVSMVILIVWAFAEIFGGSK